MLARGRTVTINVNWFHVLLLCEKRQTGPGSDIWAELVKLAVATLSPTSEPAALGRSGHVTRELSLTPQHGPNIAQSDNAAPVESTSVRHFSGSRVSLASNGTHARHMNRSKRNGDFFMGGDAHSSVATGDDRGKSPQSLAPLWPAIPAFKNILHKAVAPGANAKSDLLISLDDDSAVGNGAEAVESSLSHNCSLLQGLQSGLEDSAEAIQQQQESPQRQHPVLEPGSDLRLFQRSPMSMLERKLHDEWSLQNWCRDLANFGIQPFTIPLPSHVDVKYLDADNIHAVPELEVLLDVEQLPINLLIKPKDELCKAYDDAIREDDLERGGFADGGNGVVQAAFHLYALILQWISSYYRSCRGDINPKPDMLSVFLSEVYGSGEIERKSAAELDLMHVTTTADFIEQAMDDVLPIARRGQAPVVSEGLEASVTAKAPLPGTENLQLCTNATNQGRGEDSERPARNVFGKFVRAARGPRWSRSQQGIARALPQASNRKADYW